MQIRFDDRVVVITGAAGGIGSVLCRRFVSSGAAVVGVDISETRLRDLARELEDDNLSIQPYAADVVSEPAVVDLIRDVMAKHGAVHVLVNNAGLSLSSTALKALTSDDWDRVVEANLRSVFLCSRAVLQPMFKQRYGR